MAYTPKLNHIAGACALLFCINAQTFAQSETQLSPVVVTGEKGTGYVAKGAMIGGPGGTEEVELKDIPASINVITKDLLDDRQVKLISEAVRTDASIGDYYATIGYYENLSIRGFPLDLATSFRINGMAVTGEQNFAFENKDRVEILKGVSAMQAGASSPGGLINLVTKRPKDVMSATVGTGERGTAYAAVDYGTFLNNEKSLGIRINAAHENIKPFIKGAEGKRDFASIAVDAKISNKTLIQFDFEYQDKSQKGVPGLMLFGDNSIKSLPTGIPADIQLSRYNWVLPTEIKAINSGLRLDHEISNNLNLTTNLSRSEIRINDRLAYPYGCSTAANSDNWSSTFCSDGSFDVYDFRSDGELRRTDQIQFGLNGKYSLGDYQHKWTLSFTNLNRSIFKGKSIYGDANGYAQGTDTLNFSQSIGPSSAQMGPVRKNQELIQNSILFHDHIKIRDKFNLYLGYKLLQMDQSQYADSGSLNSAYKKLWSLPQVGINYAISSKLSNYISYSEGVEPGTIPLSDSFINTAILQPKKTKQVEAGSRYLVNDKSIVGLSIFQMERPNEYASTPISGTKKTLIQDGKVQHTGIEANMTYQATNRLNLISSAIYMKAKQMNGNSLDYLGNSPNGSQAIGIPNWKGVIFADYLIPNHEKFSVQGGWTYVSSRGVTLDNSIKAPGYHKFDAGLKYQDKAGNSKATYRLHVENVFDKFYWRDVSQTFGSNTVYPGIPRIFRATATFDF
jgi:iron complex outermembrane receptor protein